MANRRHAEPLDALQTAYEKSVWTGKNIARPDRPPALATRLAQALCAFVIAFVATGSEGHATIIGFNLDITDLSANADFGTGVNQGDAVTGMMFFNEADLTPDGVRQRSSLPGGDTLTIAGVSFDSVLNDLSWYFTFTGGAPDCFNDGVIASGCGPDFPFQTVGTTAIGQLTFRPNRLGIAREPDALGGDEVSFVYAFSVKVPEPSTLALC